MVLSIQIQSIIGIGTFLPLPLLVKSVTLLVSFRAVRVMSLNALRLFMEMDTKLFEQCTEQYRREFLRGKKAKEENDRKWEELEQLIQVCVQQTALGELLCSPFLEYPSCNSGRKSKNSKNTKNFCASLPKSCQRQPRKANPSVANPCCQSTHRPWKPCRTTWD